MSETASDYRNLTTDALVELARPHLDDKGLVVSLVPSDLMGELRRRQLAVCGGKKVKANVEGLESRWWILPRQSDKAKIRAALASLKDK